MKYSSYNVEVNHDEYILLYNVLSQALIELEQIEYNDFTRILNNPNEDVLNFYYKNGFLVDDDYNEIDFICYQNKNVCSNRSNLSLTIAPTMDCNFACPYCFEKHYKGYMSKEIQNSILDFIEEICEQNPIKNIHLKVDVIY